MRCRPCLRTGFTEAELLAHEKKTGHSNKDPIDRQSAKEFASLAPHKLSDADLKTMLKELLTPELLKEILAESMDPPAPIAEAAGAKK